MIIPRLARLRPVFVALLALAPALAGCSLLFPQAPPPTEFYVLNSTAQPGDMAPGRRLALGIGPVSLPPYLERPEMVTRTASNQVTFDEFNRWAEPLKDNFVRALATDLDVLLGFQRVVFYPWYANTPLDYSVSVAVLRFEPQADGTVVLNARWAIGDGRGRVFLNRDSHFERPTGTAAENAASLSALVGALATDIAGGLREVDESQRRRSQG